MSVPCSNCGYENVASATRCAVCNTAMANKGGQPPKPTPLKLPQSPPSVIQQVNLPKNAALKKPHFTTPQNQRYFLTNTASTRIGKSGCAIHLDGIGIQMQHAEVIPVGAGFAIQPMQGQVSIRGQVISGQVPLQDGDVVIIGTIALSYHGPSVSTMQIQLKNPPTPLPLKNLNLPPIVPQLQQAPPSKNSAQVPANWSLFQTRGIVQPVSNNQQQLEYADLSPFYYVGAVMVSIFSFTLRLTLATIGVHLGPDWGAPRQADTPIYYYIVKTSNGPVTVRLKGNLVSGRILLGDDIAFWGKWKSANTLYMRRAYNFTAQDIVIMKQTLTLGQQIRTIVGVIVAVLIGISMISSLLAVSHH